MSYARDKLLTDLSIPTTAHRDMIAMILAIHARSTGNVDGLFREVSEGLDARLETLNVTEPNLVHHVERIFEV